MFCAEESEESLVELSVVAAVHRTSCDVHPSTRVVPAWGVDGWGGEVGVRLPASLIHVTSDGSLRVR